MLHKFQSTAKINLSFSLCSVWPLKRRPRKSAWSTFSVINSESTLFVPRHVTDTGEESDVWNVSKYLHLEGVLASKSDLQTY